MKLVIMIIITILVQRWKYAAQSYFIYLAAIVNCLLSFLALRFAEEAYRTSHEILSCNIIFTYKVCMFNLKPDYITYHLKTEISRLLWD